MKWKIIYKRKTSKIIKILLANRGLTTNQQQKEFLKPPKTELLTAKEVGLDQKQISKAINRIKLAIKNQEKILVYGDYDADGICATAIIWQTLNQLRAQAMPFIPKRSEGYGMKVDRLEQFANDDYRLIITVDQGIVAYDQAKRAKKLNLDLIITDHHLPGEKKPLAYVIIHTTKLAGAGVAYFLAKQLDKNCPHLDLAVIGTITDVVPLLGSNRRLVKYGLAALRKTSRIGLTSLFQAAGINPQVIGPYEVGYLIGPRLNATGRMDDPMDSLRLLCTKDQSKALLLANQLNQQNQTRQDLTLQTTRHARDLWLKSDHQNSLIFISDESYQEGIIGLVAGKLAEEFSRPAIVIAQQTEFSRASARSIDGFNIIEAIRSCRDLLIDQGGHPKAAGFTVSTTKISLLRDRLTKFANKKIMTNQLTPTLKIDMELDFNQLNLDLYQKISQLEPFGEGNPVPVFATRQVKIVNARTVGSSNQHLALKFQIPNSKFQIKGIAFGMGNLCSNLFPDKPVDIAYNLSLDTWNNQQQLQLKIKDIKFN